MFLFPPRPAYAESHYKFQLPFSRLFRNAPELLLDAPCLVTPGVACPLWLVAREADRFPVRITGIHGEWLRGNEKSLPIRLDCDQQLTQPFHFLPFTLPPPPAPGRWLARLFIMAEWRGKTVRHERWNYPHLPPVPMLVHFLDAPLPRPVDWITGETHCHTWHSSDPVEFGAPACVLQNAARALGLDYVLTTDHSYDFAWEQGNYMKPADPQRRFAQLQKEIAELPAGPLLIAGEEVSCANSRGQNVHMLVPGNARYIPGQGDGGRRWFNNRPDLGIAEVLSQCDVPCFAAHPRVPMGKAERLIFRRGDWADADLHFDGPNPVAGLQFWNGARDTGFVAGRAFWVSQLLQGHRILPIGGNDAHGDLNDCTGVRIPLWSLKHSRHHRFGNVRTVLPHGPDAPTRHSVQAAFRGDNLYLSDGPALWWEAGSQGPVLHAASTPDIGRIQSVTLFTGTTGASLEQAQSLDCQSPYDCRWHDQAWRQANYVRAECTTSDGLFALTAAFFNDK